MNKLCPGPLPALLGAVGLLLSACASEPSGPVTRIGFEDVYGWVTPRPNWLTDTTVHSGRWAAQLLAGEDFGPAIIRPWASLGRPKALEVGAWVYLPHGRTHTALVVQVERPGGDTRYYHALPIHEVVKHYGTWQLVHARHVLPDDLRDDDLVKVYTWQWNDHYTLIFDDIYLKKLR